MKLETTSLTFLVLLKKHEITFNFQNLVSRMLGARSPPLLRMLFLSSSAENIKYKKLDKCVCFEKISFSVSAIGEAWHCSRVQYMQVKRKWQASLKSKEFQKNANAWRLQSTCLLCKLHHHTHLEALSVSIASLQWRLAILKNVSAFHS